MTNDNSIPGKIAILIFFLVAILGWIKNIPPSTAATRAIICALAIYYIIKIAIKLITNIIINQMVDNKIQEMIRKQQQNNSQE